MTLLNPPDGATSSTRVPPPVGKPDLTRFPSHHLMGEFSGVKVASVAAGPLRDARLRLHHCLTGKSLERYRRETEFPDSRPLKPDVVKDIKLLLGILHEQGPVDMLRMERIRERLQKGFDMEAIGDEFRVPIHTLRPSHDSEESGAALTDGTVKLLAASILLLQAKGEPAGKLTEIYKTLTPTQAQEVWDRAKGLFK